MVEHKIHCFPGTNFARVGIHQYKHNAQSMIGGSLTLNIILCAIFDAAQ